MRHWLKLVLVIIAGFVPASFTALAQTPHKDASHLEPAAAGTHAGAAHAAHAHEEGMPLFAKPVFFIGPLPVTNSMIITWTVALLLIIGAQLAMRHRRLVPQGAQNFWEFLVEGLYNFLTGILGAELTRRTFWFFATVFILILATNWFGLIPGVGSVGWGVPDENGVMRHISSPWLRGANADLNMTLAMSIVFFACWIVWALQANGPGGLLIHLFGPKGATTGLLKILMMVVFFAVGILEVVSILFRPVSLSFRLFGNIYAGENMLEAMATIVPALSGIIPIPFYFMELMVGLVQALVFMLLTAVFTLLICSHGDDHGPEASPAAGHH